MNGDHTETRPVRMNDNGLIEQIFGKRKTHVRMESYSADENSFDDSDGQDGDGDGNGDDAKGIDEVGSYNRKKDLQNNLEGGYYATPTNDVVYHSTISRPGIVLSTPTIAADDEFKEQCQFEATNEQSSTDDESFEHDYKPNHMQSNAGADNDEGTVMIKYMCIVSVLAVAICILASTLLYLVIR